MKYRKLGKTGLEVSEIGFGTWGIGGTHKGAIAYGPTDDKVSISALHRAYDVGITFYDTADLYGYGHSEELLGSAFETVRDKVIIASKVGFLGFEGNQDFSASHIRKSIESSLKRLQSDYIDLYQLHSPPLELLANQEEILFILQSLVEEGKVRSIGIAVRSPEEGLQAIENFDFQTIQVNFNFTDQRALDIGLFQRCSEKGVGIIVRTPLCFGFLTGHYSVKNSYDTKDHRGNWSKEQVERWANAYKLFSTGLKEQGHQTNAQIALRFCLSYPNVSTIIPGMLTDEHVQENSASSQLGPLPAKDLQRIHQIYQENSFFES